MSVNNEFPVLDGIAPSWADIIVKASPVGAALIDIKDIAAINTGTTVEIGEQQGASGGRVIKRTTGSSKAEASITLYRSGYQKLLRGLKDLAPRRGNQRLISLVHFGIQVQHTPPGDIEIYEYRIKGVRLKGRNLNSAEGTDADKVEVPLSVIEIADMIDGEEIVFL
jgi:hypothetical protein